MVASKLGDDAASGTDEDELPLTYSSQGLAAFWGSRPRELAERWGRFLQLSSPWLARLVASLVNGRLAEDEVELARSAVQVLEALGPTFVKLGQLLSARPDVLSPAAARELARLQDGIQAFPFEEARAVIERELARPLEEVFVDFSTEAVAAASLAQVHRAHLREDGAEVAVKVQRPGALATISKDLYVLRRLVDAFQPLVERFTADRTDYVALVEVFSESLYTELDFRNEALNALRMREVIADNDLGERIAVQEPLPELTARRVMTSHWVDGVRIAELPEDELKAVVAAGQEAFLVQLLEVGFFHGDPHPGNLLLVRGGPDAGKLCLLDFGLVAEVPAESRMLFVEAIVHLGTRNWEAFVNDLVALKFLSPRVDRAVAAPLFRRVLTPYLSAGGEKSSFQDLSADLFAFNFEVEWTVPSYVGLLGRAVATLEGIALLGDPSYRLVAEAYPFVVRKLLKDGGRKSALVIREVLYDSPDNTRMKGTRLQALLQAALGFAASGSAKGFVDFDALPEEGASTSELARLLFSDRAASLRPLLASEATYALDLLARRLVGASLLAVQGLAPRLPFVGRLPSPPAPPLLLPPRGGGLAPPRVLPAEHALEAAFPALGAEEDLYLESVLRVFAPTLGLSENESARLLEPSAETLSLALRALTGGGVGLQELVQEAVAEEARPAVAEMAEAVTRELLETWRSRLEAAA